MIVNLTQHTASDEQKSAGVVDLPEGQRDLLKVLLTFNALPTSEEILSRAEDIAELACYNGLGGDDGDSPMPTAAMIGGALWLMSPLACALRARSIEPLFAFSVRESVDFPQPDGSVRKDSVFRHVGFIPVVD